MIISTIRNSLAFLFFHLVTAVSMDAQDSARNNNTGIVKADFVVQIDKKFATKDGIYLGGYIVSLSYDEIKRLHKKTVRITGDVTMVSGTKHNGDGEIRQGRYEDSKHIYFPIISIVNTLSKR